MEEKPQKKIKKSKKSLEEKPKVPETETGDNLPTKWSGWKNTIRKMVKNSASNRIPWKSLRMKITKLYLKENGEIDKKLFKKTFNEKVRKAKNLVVEHKIVKYIKPE